MPEQPFQKVEGLGPHLLQGFPDPPGPPRLSKSGISDMTLYFRYYLSLSASGRQLDVLGPWCPDLAGVASVEPPSCQAR